LFVYSDHQNLTLPFEDTEFKTIINERNTRLRKVEKVVGRSPLEQIDFIIQNGFEKFNRIYYNSEGEILLRKEEESKMQISCHNDWQESGFFVSGKRTPVVSIHNSATSGGGRSETIF